MITTSSSCKAHPRLLLPSVTSNPLSAFPLPANVSFSLDVCSMTPHHPFQLMTISNYFTNYFHHINPCQHGGQAREGIQIYTSSDISQREASPPKLQGPSLCVFPTSLYTSPASVVTRTFQTLPSIHRFFHCSLHSSNSSSPLTDCFDCP